MVKGIKYFKLTLSLIFILELSACIKACAQFYGGYSLGIIRNKIIDNYDSYDNNLYGHRLGVASKLKFGYKLNQRLWLESGFSYQTKNYRIYRNGFFQETSSSFINSYLHLPLTLQINILNWNKLTLSVRVGGYAEYWLKGNTIIILPNILAPKDISDDQSYYNIYQLISKQQLNENRSFQKTDRRLQSGVILGSNICYQISNKNSIVIEPEFQSSLLGFEKKYQRVQSIKKNQSLIFTVGIHHNL